MKRQFTIFLVVSLVVVVVGLTYSSQVIADLTVFYPTSVDVSGVKIILSPSDTVASSPISQEKYHLVAQDAQRVVARRLDQLRLKGDYAVVVQDNRLEVTLPNDENMPYIINIITRVGEVEFIDGSAESPPIGQRVKTGLEVASAEEDIYQILFVGKDIVTVVPPDSRDGEIFYQLELQPSAVERFTRFVEAETDAYVCLVVDKQVINCSKMYHWSDDTLDILPNLGSGTGISLADLAVFLNSGPLPISLDVVTD